jgi:excisionase family DNA binding protein
MSNTIEVSNIGAGPGGELLTITIAEIATRYQISVKTVRRMMETGDLPKPYRFGKSVRFPRAETIRAIEAMRG